jgi:hopene-associated glycosyltransferase HpnB
LIPAFVFFFRMLYPFPTVNDPKRRTAAAAGGCMLVRRTALEDAGGIAAIRDRLIDDVALAKAIKHRPGGGRIWLGLATTTVSLRPYAGLGEIWRMVARTADVQLRHSLWLLTGTGLGMTLAYLAPPILALSWPLHGATAAAALAALAWLAMAVAFGPTARLYGQSRARGLLLPMVAALYLLMTCASAWQYRRGRGGQWKGRVGAPPRRHREDTTT